MSQIDLKNTSIYIEDGYTVVGAVNNPSAYPVGATTIVVDGLSVAIAASVTFKLTGDSTVYTVVSTIGGSTPTSVTFTPSLVVAATDNQVITFTRIGAVNNGAGYSTTTTTIAIDGITGAIPVGATFKLTGDSTIYTVGSTVGSTTPTSVTFSPGLVNAATDDEVITFSIVGAVNNPSAYPIGATSVTIDGLTAAISAGTIVTFAGDDTEYEVVSTTGGSTPTAMVITPALVVAATNNQVLTFGPHRLEVKIGEGNLSYTEKKKFKYVRDRGRLDTVTQDDEETVEVSLEFTWEFLSSSDNEPPTIEEAFKKKGNAVDWVSSADDACEPYAVNIRALNDPICADIDSELILIKDFRYESLEHSMKDGRVSVKGQANVVEAEVSRV